MTSAVALLHVLGWPCRWRAVPDVYALDPCEADAWERRRELIDDVERNALDRLPWCLSNPERLRLAKPWEVARLRRRSRAIDKLCHPQDPVRNVDGVTSDGDVGRRCSVLPCRPLGENMKCPLPLSEHETNPALSCPGSNCTDVDVDPSWNTPDLALSWMCNQLLFTVTAVERGRPAASLRDILYCAVWRTYYGLSGRHTNKALEARGAEFQLPHYNTVYLYLGQEMLTACLLDLVRVSGSLVRDDTFTPVMTIYTEDSIERVLVFGVAGARTRIVANLSIADTMLYKSQIQDSEVLTEVLVSRGSLRSKQSTARTNELLCRVVCHNVDVVLQEGGFFLIEQWLTGPFTESEATEEVEQPTQSGGRGQ